MAWFGAGGWRYEAGEEFGFCDILHCLSLVTGLRQQLACMLLKWGCIFQAGGRRIIQSRRATNHTAHTCTSDFGMQVKIGMDVAASEFLTEDKMYDLKFKEKDNDGSGKKTG
jgi:hypothetical protein